MSEQEINLSQTTAYQLTQMPKDLKRMLSVQFREFIHQLEDAAGDNALERNTNVIRVLERCLKNAA